MLNTLIDRIQKLLAVKSIVTLALTAVFCVLCLNDMIAAEQFMAIFTMVIGFYFGTQAEKKNAANTIPDGAYIAEAIEEPENQQDIA